MIFPPTPVTTAGISFSLSKASFRGGEGEREANLVDRRHAFVSVEEGLCPPHSALVSLDGMGGRAAAAAPFDSSSPPPPPSPLRWCRGHRSLLRTATDCGRRGMDQRRRKRGRKEDDLDENSPR